MVFWINCYCISAEHMANMLISEINSIFNLIITKMQRWQVHIQQNLKSLRKYSKKAAEHSTNVTTTGSEDASAATKRARVILPPIAEAKQEEKGNDVNALIPERARPDPRPATKGGAPAPKDEPILVSVLVSVWGPIFGKFQVDYEYKLQVFLENCESQKHMKKYMFLHLFRGPSRLLLLNFRVLTFRNLLGQEGRRESRWV